MPIHGAAIADYATGTPRLSGRPGEGNATIAIVPGGVRAYYQA
jgi:hypothetical protein